MFHVELHVPMLVGTIDLERTAVDGDAGLGFGSWWVRCRGGIPGLLWGDAAGESLVGSFGVVDDVEAVDVGLEFVDAGG